MGRVNVVEFEEASCSTDVISDTAGTLSLAATLGRRDFAEEECAETTWVYGESPDSRFSRSRDTTSGTGAAYCDEDAWSNEVSPFNLHPKIQIKHGSEVRIGQGSQGGLTSLRAEQLAEVALVLPPVSL